jgi:beta-xylosidase
MKAFFKITALLTTSVFLCSSGLRTAAQVNEAEPKGSLHTTTWISDNGNGTFTNPLFYDEFSDPDMIRVGNDYYLTGTTMHTMPGLPVLHSKDLVNWDLVSYAVPRLDLGQPFRLENGGNIYGQGIWAPCFRYHNGKFYIFSNVNHYTTQLFTATRPEGPWKQTAMKKSFHDLSVLFDDDGKVYVVWGYDEVHLAELNTDLSDIVDGSEQVIVPKGSGAGEGSHFYKINGKYYITNTNYDPVCYQVCLRSATPRGPYEVNVMSAKENLAIGTGYRLANERASAPFKVKQPVENLVGAIPMHQGGIVQIQSGEWWGWSMMDHNSVGRLLCLSPVTWEKDWPYFGLPGNLTRSPQTWVKPNTGFNEKPHATFRRSDDFSSPRLQPLWQWNHVPDDSKWSLKERKGYLRLKSMPATDFWNARNTLTQRAIGPESVVTVEVDVKNLRDGDLAGLALLNMPYAWIAAAKKHDTLEVRQFDLQRNKLENVALKSTRIWFRATCNFETELARFSYSTDGMNFIGIGDDYVMIYNGRTFQGERYCLFNYNTLGVNGGYADFNSADIYEPRAHGLTKPIPYGKLITLHSLADSTVLVNWKDFLRPVLQTSQFATGNKSQFHVIDRGNGRIALQSVADGRWVTVKGLGGMAEVRLEDKEQGVASQFQWQDMLKGDLMLMSLATHRYLFADPFAGSLASADAPGARPDRKDGSCFTWEISE